MKKYLNSLVVVLLTILFLTGCAAKKSAAYDNNLPQDQQCTLTVNGTLTIILFDNKKVKWNGGFFKKGVGIFYFTIKIPVGEHTFLVNYNENVGAGQFYYKNNGNYSGVYISALRPRIK